jgi:hypothetical protein
MTYQASALARKTGSRRESLGLDTEAAISVGICQQLYEHAA